jgi:hypothetical protein
MATHSISLQKCGPRPLWMVNEKKAIEEKPGMLSSDELNLAFNSQSHISS